MDPIRLARRPADLREGEELRLAREAARTGAEFQLRGADAVYAATARQQGSVLVTLDRQQLERLGEAVRVLTPAEALQEITSQTEG